MPNENQNQPEPSLEGFVPEQPEQETPVETPPVVEGSEEPTPVVEKPAPPDSTEAVAEGAAPTKTPEQIEKDRAYHQKEAQDAKEKLRRIQEQFAEQEQVEQADQTSESQADPDRSWLSQLQGLSQEEINERLRDDPVLQMQLQDYRDEQRLNRVLDKRDAMAEGKARYRSEAAATERHLEAFCDKHSIDASEVFKIKDELVKMGVKGSPAAIGGLIQDRLNMMLSTQNIEQRATEAAAKAAQAAKTQVLTTQPDGGGPQVPVAEKSLENQIADRFKPSSGKQAITQLFG